MIKVNNLTTKTEFRVNSFKKDYVEFLNSQPNTSIIEASRTDNGWYVLTINNTRMILEIIEEMDQAKRITKKMNGISYYSDKIKDGFRYWQSNTHRNYEHFTKIKRLA